MTETTTPPGEVSGFPMLLTFNAADSTTEKLTRLLSNQGTIMYRLQNQGTFAQEVYFQLVDSNRMIATALAEMAKAVKEISQKLGPDRTTPTPPTEIT